MARQNTITSPTATAEISPVDALWVLIQSQTKAVRKALTKRLIEDEQSAKAKQEAMVNYEIDEYDERFLRHLALGYTKEQITNLRGMPFGVKSLEKRQNELIQKLFPDSDRGTGVNATRLVVKALELRILDLDNLMPDEE